MQSIIHSKPSPFIFQGRGLVIEEHTLEGHVFPSKYTTYGPNKQPRRHRSQAGKKSMCKGQTHKHTVHMCTYLDLYLSLGSKPFGVDCIGLPINFSRLRPIIFTMAISAPHPPHHHISLLLFAWDRHSYTFWFLW